MTGLLSSSCLIRDGRVWSFLSMVLFVIFLMSVSVSVVVLGDSASLVRDWSLSSSTARSAVCKRRTSMLVVASSWTWLSLMSRSSMVLGKGLMTA